MVNHKKAIKDLLEMNVPPIIVKWIANFLTERQQRVKYKQAFSEWQTLTGAVPQGTKLGPLIFRACINNAADHAQSKCWKYVDDLTLSENRHINSLGKIQDDLNDLSDWAVENGLSLNPSKRQMMQIYSGRRDPPDVQFFISNVPLQQVHCVMLLGITLQHNLKWDSHLVDMINKVNRKLFMLRKFKKKV